MEDFVADSEEEAQLRLSASISPRRALESAFSRDITSDTSIAQPKKTFAASVISQFTSTIASSSQKIDESPIVQFSTAETRVSITKTKTPRHTDEIIDISDDDGSFSHVASSSRQPRPDSAGIEPKRRKKKPKETKAARKEAGRDRQPPSIDGVLTADEPLERVSITDESDLQETRVEKDKKRPTKLRKKGNKTTVPETSEVSSVASEKHDSPPPSKKRKAADAPSVESSKPAKKRKRTPPQEGGVDRQDKPMKAKAPRTSRAKQSTPTDDGADSAPDELLLAPEGETKTSNKSRKAAIKPPSNTSTAPSVNEPSPPRSESPETERPPPVAQPPPTVVPPAKLTPRSSLVQQNAHQIPKRGSISSLLRKTRAYAPLSSSKLTRTIATKIAPLHADRKTPPPLLAPIPKPKKKVVEEEDEEDFTGMTEKQIEKYKEEKRKKAWYSP